MIHEFHGPASCQGFGIGNNLLHILHVYVLPLDALQVEDDADGSPCFFFCLSRCKEAERFLPVGTVFAFEAGDEADRARCVFFCLSRYEDAESVLSEWGTTVALEEEKDPRGCSLFSLCLWSS